MFIGHFGVGFAAKPLAPRVSLGTLFLAAQFLDLLWPTLLLLGVEQVRIEPGATRVTPLLFEHYPVSHSLLAVLGWALLVAGLHFVVRRNRRSSLILGLLVISHWLLDAVVHAPDLPLAPGSPWRVGLGAWTSLPLTLLVEGSLFVACVVYYLRRTTALDAAGRWGCWALVGFLAVIYLGNLFGGPPPNVEAIAWVGQLQWLIVLWGYWVDRHRQVRLMADPRR